MTHRFLRTALVPLLALNVGLSSGQSTPIAEFATDAAGGPSAAVAMGGKLYFTAYDEAHGRELWVTDGSSEGTYLVKDIKPGIGSGLTDIFDLLALAVDDELYFRADDGVSGNELWRSDGTEAGTTLVKDLQGGFYGSNPGSFAEVDGMLFFTAFSGSQLWRSNGTASGTQLVRTFSVATWLFGHQGTLYFAGDADNTGQELWKSNGTFNTTERVRDLNGAIGASLPVNFHSAGDLLYFDAVTGTGWELWRTDGTEEGTLLVKDINPGGANGTLNSYANVAKANLGDTLYFRANDGLHGHQLWRTNGTEASTVRVSNLPDGVDASCRFPINAGQVLMNNYITDRWWAYDPATDTTLQTNYPSAYYFNWAGKYVFLEQSLFYAGKDTAYGCELWRADGQAGDAHRTQETHFTDNWLATAEQPFTSLLGSTYGKVLFTQARSAYNLHVPMFSHDPAGMYCPPPYSALGIPVAGAGLHVVIARWADYGEKLVRYRPPGSLLWETTTTNTGFAELDVDAGQPLEFSVKVDCDGAWSEWSPLFSYDPAQVPTGLYQEGSIVADRGENATTMRIYWTRTPQVVAMQLRYRPYATPGQPWQFASDTTGMRRLTNLEPETLYTYDYRFNDGTVWSPWSSASLYFTTHTPDLTTAIGTNDAVSLSVMPNPAMDHLYVRGVGDAVEQAVILDELGRAVWRGPVVNGMLSIGHLQAGSYVLVLQSEGRVRKARFVRS